MDVKIIFCSMCSLMLLPIIFGCKNERASNSNNTVEIVTTHNSNDELCSSESPDSILAKYRLIQYNHPLLERSYTAQNYFKDTVIDSRYIRYGVWESNCDKDKLGPYTSIEEDSLGNEIEVLKYYPGANIEIFINPKSREDRIKIDRNMLNDSLSNIINNDEYIKSKLSFMHMYGLRLNKVSGDTVEFYAKYYVDGTSEGYDLILKAVKKDNDYSLQILDDTKYVEYD
ncbi:MAG: hypothetical protein K2J10_07885 [Muribaculaceae bacterium]|nr:hypothetical protein [Muribaculaceae bacterium]